MKQVRLGRGRPPKYARPSHAVTVTLPLDVIDRLRAADPDLGRAIVALATDRWQPRIRRVSPAELAPYGNHAVIVVNPVPALKRCTGVQLVPLGDGRALISLDPGGSIAGLELNLRDALERPNVKNAERQTLEAIADILRDARRSPRAALRERTIIVLEAKRRRRA